MTASDIYQQCLDKQRIIFVGEGSGLIIRMVQHVLKFHNRKFDSILPGQLPVIQADSPLIIIEAIDQLLDYKHHIVVFSDVGSSDDLKLFEQLASATPKGGTLLYPDLNAALKSIYSKERTDVQSIPYTRYKHELKDGKVALISSTGERFPLNFGGDKNLEYVGAAKELVKKIGISSGQFYKAISTYLPA